MKSKKEQPSARLDSKTSNVRHEILHTECQRVKPSIIKELGQHGHVYISYPAGTIGEQMPCVFCPDAECESVKSIGSKFPTIRYKCPVNCDRLSNPPLGIPKNCPRLNK